MFDISGGSLVGLRNLIFRIELGLPVFFEYLLRLELSVDIHIVLLMLLLLLIPSCVSLRPPLDHQFDFSPINLTSVLYILEFGQSILIAATAVSLTLQPYLMQWIFCKVDINRAADIFDLNDCKSTLDTRSMMGAGSTLLGVLALREVAICSRSWSDILIILFVYLQQLNANKGYSSVNYLSICVDNKS